MGAGLGGGSSDAAAVLITLPVLAGKTPELPALIRLAGELGSDVPFFLLGGAAVAVGRGTELAALGLMWSMLMGVIAVVFYFIAKRSAAGAFGRA